MSSFLDGFKNLFSFGSKKALGLDIGTTTIKAVELTKDRLNRLSLTNYGFLENYGHLERINDAFQTSDLKLMETDVAEVIKKLLDAGGFKAKKVGMSIPIYSVFASILNFPKMPDQELVKAIPFRARQIIPMPLEEAILDWTEVIPSQEEKIYKNSQERMVFLIAVPREVVERYKRIAKMIELDLVSLELESLSEGRALLGDDKTTSFILDIGSRVTNLMIFDNGYLRVSKFFDLASGDMSQVIANGLKIDIWRAEKIKKENGLLSQPGQEEIINLLYPTIDAIVKESKDIINRYKQDTSREVKKILLAGASANMPGLKDYLANQFEGISLEISNAFTRVNYPTSLEPLMRLIKPSFGPCIGAATKVLE